MNSDLKPVPAEGVEPLREQLAALAHEQWSGWMRYLFSKCRYTDMGDAVIPKSSVLWWQRQMGTPYDDLSEPEKDSDRKEADRVLHLLTAQSAAHRPQEEDVLGITIPMNAEELDWVEHAARLREFPVAEYIRRAINLSLRKEGVDAVLLRQSDDE